MLRLFKRGSNKPPRRPWWTEETIDAVEKILRPDMSVFEWGSGSSTVWLAHRVKRVWSVDHDKFWRGKIRKWARREGVSGRIRVFVCPFEKAGYYNRIAGFKSGFDLVIVDGRNRVECFKKAIGSLKSGGYIMVDDTQRPAYSQIYGRSGLEIVQDAVPDQTGKKATIFRKK